MSKEIEQWVIAHHSDLILFYPLYYKNKGWPIPDWVKDNVLSRMAADVYGPFFCFVGILFKGVENLLRVISRLNSSCNKCCRYLSTKDSQASAYILVVTETLHRYTSPRSVRTGVA